MGEMNFTEDDKQKVIEFMNMIAKNAKFKFKTEDVINYFKLIAHMQQKILPKIEANILEVKRIIEAKEQTDKQV